MALQIIEENSDQALMRHQNQRSIQIMPAPLAKDKTNCHMSAMDSMKTLRIMPARATRPVAHRETRI